MCRLSAGLITHSPRGRGGTEWEGHRDPPSHSTRERGKAPLPHPGCPGCPSLVAFPPHNTQRASSPALSLLTPRHCSHPSLHRRSEEPSEEPLGKADDASGDCRSPSLPAEQMGLLLA